MTSYGSTTSINSGESSTVTPSIPEDNPEQFEVLKQQKEIWEAGIEM